MTALFVCACAWLVMGFVLAIIVFTHDVLFCGVKLEPKIFWLTLAFTLSGPVLWFVLGHDLRKDYIRRKHAKIKVP